MKVKLNEKKCELRRSIENIWFNMVISTEF